MRRRRAEHLPPPLHSFVAPCRTPGSNEKAAVPLGEGAAASSELPPQAMPKRATKTAFARERDRQQLTGVALLLLCAAVLVFIGILVSFAN